MSDKNIGLAEFERKRKELPKLPEIGSTLETIKDESIYPEDCKGEKGFSVRASVTDLEDGEGDPKWYIHNNRGGLVVILKPEPDREFERVRITGHAKSGKCVFGKIV